MAEFRVAAAAAALLALAGAPLLTACDDQPQRSARTAGRGERTAGESPRDPGPQKTESAQPGPPEQVRPGARPQSPPGAAGLIGTWRVRLKSGAEEAQPGVTYTFTGDGRVTVGPDQVCRYKLANETLAIDCAGTSAASASGRLERQDADNLLWRVGDKTVLLERQAGVKEQQ